MRRKHKLIIPLKKGALKYQVLQVQGSHVCAANISMKVPAEETVINIGAKLMANYLIKNVLEF